MKSAGHRHVQYGYRILADSLPLVEAGSAKGRFDRGEDE